MHHWTLIDISKTKGPRVMKFGQHMNVNDLKVVIEGQGQRSRSRGQKTFFRSHWTTLQVIFEVKGHMGQGQRST